MYFSPIFAGMETNRQKKIARLLQKDLGEILQLNGRTWFPGAMLTVTKVNVTADLSIARVYVSIFGKEAKVIIKQLEMQAKEVRKQLGLRVKNQLRHIPELRFYVDDSLDYIENIEKLLRE
jgi:ribosome-binding factor A